MLGFHCGMQSNQYAWTSAQILFTLGFVVPAPQTHMSPLSLLGCDSDTTTCCSPPRGWRSRWARPVRGWLDTNASDSDDTGRAGGKEAAARANTRTPPKPTRVRPPGPVGWRFAAALLPRLFGKNPRSHHKGATGLETNGF